MKRHALGKPLFLATTGAVLYAFSVVLFYDPNAIAPGGVSGIALILSHLFPVLSTGTLILLLNIPLFILAFRKFGKFFVFLTLYTTVLSSLLMNLLEVWLAPLLPLTDDLLIAALGGACLGAVSIGLVYRSGGSTGGTDIVIKMLRKRYRHIPTGMMSLLVNAVIVAASFAAFGKFEISVYSAIAMAVEGFVLDKVLYGGDSAKLVLIVTNREEELTAEILRRVNIGVTLLDATGAYTKRSKKVLLCIVKKHNFPLLRDVVKTNAPDAFMIVSSANEIFGEGYKDPNSEEL